MLNDLEREHDLERGHDLEREHETIIYEPYVALSYVCKSFEPLDVIASNGTRFHSCYHHCRI